MSIIDTRATSYIMRDNISSLDTYIAMVNSDIDKFNKYTKINYDALTARGERWEVRRNDFKPIQGISCGQRQIFVRYIQHQKDKYNNEYNIWKDKLMKLALNKYENICTKDKWLAKSP